MLKKLVMLILVLLCLLPSISFANDAGPYLDTEGKLSIEFKLKSHEAKIGGTLEFTLILTNNTAKPMDTYLLMREIFKNTDLTKDTYKVLNDLPELNTGEKVELLISANVEKSVYWYKKENSYYTDFRLLFDYYAWEYDGDDIDDGWYRSYYYESKSIPIKLTNVYDGKEILKIESTHKEDALYFGKYLEPDGGNHGLSSCIHSKLSATNLSLHPLSDITIRKEMDYDVLQIDTINPSEVYTQEIICNEYIESSNLPSKKPLEIKAIFELNDKYYASEFSKELSTKLIEFPEVKLYVEPDSNNSNNNILIIKNTSGRDYEDFYIGFYEDYPHIYYTDNIIAKFDKGEQIEFSLENESSYYNIVIGYVQDNMLFTWIITINSDSSHILDITFKDVIDLENDEIPASPTPSPSPSPTPTPEPTVTATPSPSPTASPTPAITVNSITKKPAVPSWVWIALACALLATVAVSVLLHVRRSNTNDK